MPGPHLDLHAHLRNRRNVSGHTLISALACSEETKGVLGLDRCPEPVGCFLYFYLVIFYKQSKSIFPIWDVVQSDICVTGKISGMGPNWSQAPHDLDANLG